MSSPFLVLDWSMLKQKYIEILKLYVDFCFNMAGLVHLYLNNHFYETKMQQNIDTKI